ncbi:MAG: hypothetical protein COT74_03020 [Bdellovibrionales bacterium CG10_big_fil_rev_8_21_14_0_10_45_34]|nr:MAG: hypothetical protein COT74_03020 [Bdellovibrionales bacterium CG10_big_fil_rev_8_21_14_0_10_45_34]
MKEAGYPNFESVEKGDFASKHFHERRSTETFLAEEIDSLWGSIERDRIYNDLVAANTGQYGNTQLTVARSGNYIGTGWGTSDFHLTMLEDRQTTIPLKKEDLVLNIDFLWNFDSFADAGNSGLLISFTFAKLPEGYTPQSFIKSLD